MNTYKFEEIQIGMKEGFTVKVSEEMLQSFKIITGDINPLHCDEDFAITQGYKNCISYGMLTASFLSTLAGVYLPGKYSLIHEVKQKFVMPVYVGDTLNVVGKVISKNEAFHCFDMKIVVTNQDEKQVLRGSMRVGVLNV